MDCSVAPVGQSQFPSSVEMNRMVSNLLQPFLVKDSAFVARVKKVILAMYGLPEDMQYFCGALPCSLMRADLHFLGKLFFVCLWHG